MALSLATLFPNGVVSYAVGGLLLGLAVLALYVGTGIIVGASSFLESTLSYVSRLPRLQDPRYRSTRDWRVVFTIGIVLGGTLYAVAFGDLGWTTAVQPWRLLVGGVLVGVGTRVGKGCTSGHGICGLGSVSRTSIVNVAVFVAVAIVVAFLVSAAGVTP